MEKVPDKKEQFEIKELQAQVNRLQEQNSRLNKQVNAYLRQKTEFQKTLSRYKEAQAIGHVGNWEYEIQTETFWGSEEAKRIYGFNPEASEFTTDEVENCIPERQRVHQALIDLIEKDTPYDLEFEIITKDKGLKRTIRSIAKLHRNANGDPLKVTGLITDITEQKKIEQQLRESEERFRFLTDATFEGIVVHRNGIVLDANDSFLKMTGYKREEILGKNLLDHIPNIKDRAKVMMKIVKSKASPYTIMAVRKNGTTFIAELEARNVKKAGKTLRIVAVRDVTRRIELEKEAEEIRERYKYMFNSAPVSIWEEDFSEAFEQVKALKKKGIKNFEKYFQENPQEVAACSQKVKILDVNTTTVSMFNAPSKTEFFKNLSAVFTDESLATFKDQLIKIANQETFYEGKCINKTFDGRLLNVYLRWNTVPGFEKDYSRVLVSLLDETEKEKAAKALQESQRQITAIMNDPATFLGIIEPDGTLVNANESALNFIGRSLSDVKGKKFWSTPWWKHSEELQEKLKTSISKAAAGETSHFEADHRGPNDQKLFVNFSIRPVTDQSGKILNLIVEGLDRTEQKIAEEKVSKLLAEKEMLLREVHHRIKNNMATVESLFKIKSMMSKDAKIQSAFQEAISRLRSMRVLYDKLYRSSDFKFVSLNEYLPGLVEEIISVFPLGKEVKIITDIEKIQIPADLNFPVCIMVNELITNTMKYAFTEAEKEKKITVKGTIKEGLVSLLIEDNGQGLPADFDLESSDGYGVKLVKNLAKQIKGEIRYKVDNGTSWLLTFDI